MDLKNSNYGLSVAGRICMGILFLKIQQLQLSCNMIVKETCNHCHCNWKKTFDEARGGELLGRSVLIMP